MTVDWRPSASLQTLRARADLFARVRRFFAARGVLEVETPMLSVAATVDPHIESLRVDSSLLGTRYLHSSPEFPMKRLLAAGSGPIYQICRVFRADEQGRLHNPEFTMLEWYRPGFDQHQLMNEVEALVTTTMQEMKAPLDTERLSYRLAIQREAGIDPFNTGIEGLRDCLEQHGVTAPVSITVEEVSDLNFWLDMLMGMVVGPKLGRGRLCFIYDYPASQAALARIREGTPPVAERFELYWEGVEVANGFHELIDAGEQARRFAADLQRRERLGRSQPPHDQAFIEGLKSGLPACAGVAMGLDRILMLLLGLDSLAETLAFPVDRA